MTDAASDGARAAAQDDVDPGYYDRWDELGLRAIVRGLDPTAA